MSTPLAPSNPRPPEPQENLLQAIRDNAERHKKFWEYRIQQLYRTIRESQDEINEIIHKRVALEISESAVQLVTREPIAFTSSNMEIPNESEDLQV